MIFYFASIFESGHVIEQQTFDSASFDRAVVERYVQLIVQGEDFGEDLQEVHVEFTTSGPKSAIVEISSEKGDVVMHLLATTEPNAAMKELQDVLITIHNPDEPLGEVVQIKARPLALALLSDATAETLVLSRYPIALAAAFFEAKVLR